MAVKTRITDDAFKEILAGYTLGEFVESQPICGGTVQTNYRLLTTEAMLVFRYYENRSAESVAFETELLCFLKGKGFPCPAPYPNRRGESIGFLQGKPFVLFEFMQGEHVPDPDESQGDRLFRLAARLNGLTMGYSSVHSKTRLTYEAETCRGMAAENSERIGTQNARAKLAWYKGELNGLRLPASHPRCVCHCDFHFTNILMREGSIEALLDFDDANITYATFDLAYLMQPFKAGFEWDTWSRFAPEDDILDLARARHVASVYEEGRPLAEEEKRHLFDVCKLSILVDCIWYFERGSVSDFFEKRKLDALDRLGREQFYQELFG